LPHAFGIANNEFKKSMSFLRMQESIDVYFHRHDMLKLHIIRGIYSSFSDCVLILKIIGC